MTYFKTLRHVAYLSLVVISMATQNANALEANASAKWVYNDTDPVTANGNAGTGNFTVGPDVVTVAGQTVQQPAAGQATTFPYAANAGAGPVGFTATLSKGGTTATATSNITVNPPIGAYHPWALNLNANVTRSGFSSPAGTATAPGSDPDPFNPSFVSAQPIYQETVTLGAGSSVFEGDQADEAFTTMSRTTTLLDNPIFSIEISGLGSGLVDASVHFNNDPSLSFSTSESALEALLENSALGTSAGSSSDISFNYEWDLSNFNVTSNDTIGGDGVSFASSVPEPESYAMLAAGLGLVSFMARRRKQNQAN